MVDNDRADKGQAQEMTEPPPTYTIEPTNKPVDKENVKREQGNNIDSEYQR